MSKIIVRLAAVLALSVGTVAAVAAPASAAYSSCPAGVGCLWMNQGGTGNWFIVPVGTYGIGGCANLHLSGYPTWLADNAESGRAGYGSGLRLQIWEHANCTGQNHIFQNGDNQSLGNAYMVNKASAVRILPAA